MLLPGRLTEGDIIRQATQPKTYIPSGKYIPAGSKLARAPYGPAKPQAPTIDPSWYMNSRAYANAVGVQKDLGVPNSSNATDPASGLKGTGGSSGGSGARRSLGGPTVAIDPLADYVPKVADLSQDPYAPAYAQLDEYIKKSAASRPLETAAANAAFRKQYEAMNAQLQSNYDAGAAQLNQAAINLGVDPTLAGKTRADAFAHSMDNSALQLQGDLDWTTKLGLLSQNMAKASAIMYAGQGAAGSAGWKAKEQARIGALNLATLQNILDQKLAKAKGGGGGGRRGGGGSSSGATSVTETSTLDPAIQEQYLALAAKDPKAAAEYMNMVNLATGGALGAAQKNVNNLTAIVNRPKLNVPKPSPTNVQDWLVPFIRNNVINTVIGNQAKAAQGKLSTGNAVLDAMMATYSPINPKTKITQTTKGKVNTKIK